MLGSLLVDFAGMGPPTGENLLEPSASALLCLLFARYPREKACSTERSLTLAESSGDRNKLLVIGSRSQSQQERTSKYTV